MMRPDAKVEKVYLYPKPINFRKSIDSLAALVELDIKAAVFDPVLFVFLNKPRNQVKVLYWERNGFCLWLKRLESEHFKTSPNCSDEAIVLTVQELNWLLDSFDLWRDRPHQVLTPRFVA
jgi:transposase